MQFELLPLRPSVLLSGIVNIRPCNWERDFLFEGESHACWEMQYMAGGSVFINKNSRFYRLRHGELTFFRPHEFHVVYGDGEGPSEMWVFSFCAESAQLERLGHTVFAPSEPCVRLLRQTLQEANLAFDLSESVRERSLLRPKQQPFLGSEQLVKLYLEEVLIGLLRAMDAPSAFARNIAMQARTDHNFFPDSVRQFLQEHLGERLTLLEIARRFYVSESFVKTRYKARFGCSVMADFGHMKAERAKALLCCEDYKITQVAAELAFENLYYFSNFFKHQTGMSPSAYRIKMQQ